MAEVKSSDLSKNIQVTVGEIISELPEFRGMWLPSASHSTLEIKLCHSSKIQSSYRVIGQCVCACPRF